MRTTFTFSQKVHCCHSQKDGKGFKTSTPCFLPLPLHLLLPVFPRLRRPQTPSLPSIELLRAPPLGFPWSRGLELRTPPSWDEKLVAQDGVGLDNLVHNDVDWMGPPGMRNWLHKMVMALIISSTMTLTGWAHLG